MEKIKISGFADEISSNFDDQLEVVKNLGMEYICLRSADSKNVADFSLSEFEDLIYKRLEEKSIKISSLGSPIGKIYINDEPAFDQQLKQLENLCKICRLSSCKYIRMFSFYMPKGEKPEKYKYEVVKKIKKFTAIAKKYNVILIHENEKDIFGDTGDRCKYILDNVNSKNFRLAFDFANFVQCGEDPMACYELLKEYIAYIHIKDAVTSSNENVLCGTGEGRIEEILNIAINVDGYEGFLTLEPHLVLFDSLQSLELEDATEIIKENKYKTGAEAYQAQYEALKDILNKINKQK